MNYEETLKAMAQGKKVRRMSWNDGSYICFNSAGDIVDENGWLFLLLEIAKSGDWEIYEEPQKEPEMTAGHAIEVLESIRQVTSKSVIPDVDEVIDFAIKTLENQNQQVLVFDPENLSQKELEKVQEKLKECKFEVKPEKKCECECKCNHTVEDADLQEKMKQVLSRKFFEIEKYSDDESTVNSMLNIYNSIFSD